MTDCTDPREYRIVICEDGWIFIGATSNAWEKMDDFTKLLEALKK